MVRPLAPEPHETAHVRIGAAGRHPHADEPHQAHADDQREDRERPRASEGECNSDPDQDHAGGPQQPPDFRAREQAAAD
jgi:hypothetical protein